MIYIVKPTFLAILVVVGLKGVYIAPRAPPRPQEKRAYGKEDLIEKFLRWGLPVSQVCCMRPTLTAMPLTPLNVPR